MRDLVESGLPRAAMSSTRPTNAYELPTEIGQPDRQNCPARDPVPLLFMTPPRPRALCAGAEPVRRAIRVVHLLTIARLGGDNPHGVAVLATLAATLTSFSRLTRR